MNYGVSLSGLNAAQTNLKVVAHNIANMNTENFKEKKVILEENGNNSGVRVSNIVDSNPDSKVSNDVNIEKQMVSLIENKNYYMFNAKAIMIADKALGSLLDIKV